MAATKIFASTAMPSCGGDQFSPAVEIGYGAVFTDAERAQNDLYRGVRFMRPKSLAESGRSSWSALAAASICFCAIGRSRFKRLVLFRESADAGLSQRRQPAAVDRRIHLFIWKPFPFSANDNSQRMLQAINGAVKRGAHLGLRAARA